MTKRGAQSDTNQKGIYEEFATAIIDQANREAAKSSVFCLQWMELRLSIVSDVRGKGYLFQVLNSQLSADAAIETLRFNNNKIGAYNAATVFWSAVTYSKELLNGDDAAPFFERDHFNLLWKDTVVLRFYKYETEEKAVKKIADMIFSTPFSS